MQNTIAATSFLMTIILGALAIWISLYVNNSTKQTLDQMRKESSETFTQMRQELGDMRGIIRTTQLELPHSISSLHQLRDSLIAFPDIPLTARGRIHSLETVAMEERRVKRAVWILAVTVEYELSPVYQSVIASNMLAGVNYTYFLPQDIRGGLDASLGRLLGSIRDNDLDETILKKQLRIYEVHDATLLANITLHDPTIGERSGYLLPVYSSKEWAFQVTLDDDLYDRIRSTMDNWLVSSKQIYPDQQLPPSG
jgi:hypothetical protein